MKKKYNPVGFFFVAVTFMQSVCAYDSSEGDFWNYADNPASVYESTSLPSVMRSTIEPDTLVSVLFNAGIVDLLREPFFLRTNPLATRNVLDFPFFIKEDHHFYKKSWGVDFFFNSTDRMYFTRKEDGICSYLAIAPGTGFIDRLEAILEEVQGMGIPSVDANLDDISRLFSNLTVQERKTGFMLQGSRSYRNWTASFRVPFYYFERNYFLTEEEQEEATRIFGEGDDDFNNEHLISDKLGFGDTRLQLDVVLKDEGSIFVKGGLLATLPTAFSLKNGLKGNTFKSQSPAPIFDLCMFEGLDNQEAIFKAVGDYAVMALDHLSKNLIDAPLGNRGHPGLGTYLQYKTPLSLYIQRPWVYHLIFNNFMSLEYLFPAHEDRYYVKKIDQQEFDALFPIGFNPLDQSISAAQERLDFITSQLSQRLFPRVIQTRVSPGIIFRWATQLVYERPSWGVSVGTDTWATGKEMLAISKDTCKFLEQLEQESARTSFGYQWKVLGSLFFKSRKNRDWLFALNIDKTFSSRSLGSDFTVYIGFEMHY